MELVTIRVDINLKLQVPFRNYERIIQSKKDMASEDLQLLTNYAGQMRTDFETLKKSIKNDIINLSKQTQTNADVILLLLGKISEKINILINALVEKNYDVYAKISGPESLERNIDMLATIFARRIA